MCPSTVKDRTPRLGRESTRLLGCGVLHCTPALCGLFVCVLRTACYVPPQTCIMSSNACLRQSHDCEFVRLLPERETARTKHYKSIFMQVYTIRYVTKPFTFSRQTFANHPFPNHRTRGRTLTASEMTCWICPSTARRWCRSGVPSVRRHNLYPVMHVCYTQLRGEHAVYPPAVEN